VGKKNIFISTSPYFYSMKKFVATLRRSMLLQVLVLVQLTPGLVFLPVQLNANPEGGVVVAGNVSFSGLNTPVLDINNASQHAIIDWQSFSIAAGEVTNINQAANAHTLNRVISSSPTEIYGMLKAANGGVTVINSNGIMVGESGVVDIAGLMTMSTLDVSNNDFLNGGSNNYKGDSSAGIRNYGSISSQSGDVVLLGNFLQNAGNVSAPDGTVAFGAGGDMIVDQGGGGVISVRGGGSGGETGIENTGSVNAAGVELKAHGNVYALAIKNDGLVRASGYNFKGGRLTLSGGSNGNIVNNGQLQARNRDGSGGQVEIAGGRVQLASGSSTDASGELGRSGGSVNVSGDDVMINAAATVSASGASGGAVSISGASSAVVNGSVDSSGEYGKGGRIDATADSVTIGSTATLNASGYTGGGQVRVGGGFQGKDAEVANADNLTVESGALIISDAEGSGTGGNIILWSDGDTVFAGDVSARGISGGGFAEISGKSTLDVVGNVDLTSVSGAAGTVLLDPTNILISATGAPGIGGSTISNVWISGQLDMGTNVVISSNFGGAEEGTITVGRIDTSVNAAADQIEWYQNDANTVGGTLSLLAMGDINFNSAVHSAGQGGINVVAGWDGTTGLTMGNFNMAEVLATMNDGNAANDAAGRFNATFGTYGSVTVGNTVSRTGVDVGSRWGDTNVAARDLFLRGSTTVGRGFAQVGFADNGVEYQLSRTHNGLVYNEWWGNAAGNVQGKDYIALLGGTEFGTGDINTLGTRAFRGAGWGATGDVSVGLSGRLDARGGTTASYTQIGHGGNLQDGTEDKWNSTVGNALNAPRVTRDGIQIAPANNRYSFFASTWRTNYAGNAARIDGDISVTADGDILLMGSRDFDVNDDQSTVVTDGTYSLIGNGGTENHASTHGDVTVIAHGSTPAGFIRGPEGLGIQLIGGRGSRSFVQIGHGTSYEGNSQSVWDQSSSGDIVVTATTGAIRLLGHNQAVRNGDINSGAIISGTETTPQNNLSDASNLGSHVQIGHGGATSVFPGAGGTFIMPGGTNVANIIPDNSMTGDITVTAAGTFVDPRDPGSNIGIQVKAGNRRWFHAMIGHGGTNLRAENLTAQTPNFGAGASLPFGSPTLAPSIGFQGNIRVEADKGDVVVAGGDNFRADRTWGYGYNFARVGHGGDVVRGPKGGDITVLAGQGAGALDGDIRFTAGRMYHEHAQLGHGGYDSDSTAIGGWDSLTKSVTFGANTAEIIATARGDISFISPPSGEKDALRLSTDYTYWWFSNASPTGASQTGNTGYWQTEDRFVQLGHGGYASTTIMPDKQDITVTAGTGDLANADGDDTTGGINFTAGDMERDYAQLGHGGHSSSANNPLGFTGDLNVTANGGGLRFDGSIFGAQGLRRSTTMSLNGSTTTTVVRGEGGGAEAYVQLGHGGYGARGIHTGDINIETWGGIDFLAALSSPAVDRVGNTTIIQQALATGNGVWIPLGALTSTAYPSVAVPAPTSPPYDQPDPNTSVIPGSVVITLSDGRQIIDVVRNSNDDRNSAPLGGTPTVVVPQAAAGLFLDGVKVGEINYTTGLVSFRLGGQTALSNTGSGIDPTPAPVDLGVGVTVTSTTFQTAQGIKERAYAQLGHGGYESEGPNNKANNLPSMSGDINILAGGDIRFQAGAWHRAYAQLGHGGWDVKGIKSGDISIDSVDPNHLVGGYRFTAGQGAYRQFDYQAYAQLGHGGFDSDGNSFGNITVRGTEDLDGVGMLFKAGTREDNYVHLGHGGRSARPGTGDGANSFGLNGDIDIEVTGDVAFVAGTFDKANASWTEDGRLYALLGHGGWDTDPSNNDTDNFGQKNLTGLPAGTAGAGDGNWGHFGDISLVSVNGDISFMAGDNTAVASRVDFDGNPLGLPADPNGLLTSLGSGAGRFHFAQLGHGGYAAGGDHNGNITVRADNGGVHVVGGMLTQDNDVGSYTYAQIGHGATNDNGVIGAVDQFIKVHGLGGDVIVMGGQSPTASFGQIGHGGYNSSGDKTADISVIAVNNLLLNSGAGVFANNWGKIGHGDVRNLGTGTRNGDIHVSVGDSLYMGQALIGHIDFKIAPDDFLRSTQGDTFIAVGRNNPYTGGTGEFVTTNRSVITSAGAGIFGDLRLYMPDATSNLIATGTYLNNANYVRVPAPGSGRADEQVALEHEFPADNVTEADAMFTPEGDYPAHAFGLYNVYYGEATPVTPPPLPPGTDFIDYDAYDRDNGFFGYDGYEEMLFNMALEDAMEDDSNPSTGVMTFEEWLDGNLGSRREGRNGTPGSVIEDEEDEELRRRKRFAKRQVGRGALTYYVFDPGTNRLSSYRVFGVPNTALSVTQ